MSKISRAYHEIQSLGRMAEEDKWINRVHPLAKLVVTMAYIGTVVSYDKYNLNGLPAMAVYPVILFIMGDISVREGLYRMRVILPFVCMVGMFNPFLDREAVMSAGGFVITGGMLSMLTLIIKGILTVFASYLLIVTTTIEKICHALRMLRLPKIFVTQILLTYRYITVLLAEAERMTQAYSLRAPGQKGVHIRVWGSLLGQLLLRSMDRAQELYDSMCLRGYQGEFYFGRRMRFLGTDFAYLLLWAAVFYALRFLPVLEWIGGLLIRK